MANDRGETLTESMLAALPARLRPMREGQYMRCGCPFHGSDRQRSLSITIETGRFQCFSCGVWGYTEKARDEWKAANANRPPPSPLQRSSDTTRLRDDPVEPEPLSDDGMGNLREWQAALPEAADYLASRRIPLDLVRDMGGGVGTLAGARRLILPHTDPQGRVVSLYGRRIDGADDLKHYHLPGRAKGALNAAAFNGREAWITEGAFDALALMAAGIPCAAAVYGVNGIRWGWLKGVRRIVLAFDCDEAGRRALAEHAKQALMRGAEVLAVMPDELGGAKDIAEAWELGTLRLSGVDLPRSPAPAEAPTPAPDAGPVARWRKLVAKIPDGPPAGLSPVQWADYRAACSRFVLEGLAAQAAAHGWTERELFALPPDPRRPWEGGVLWAFAGDPLQAIDADGVRSAKHTLQRHNLEDCNLGALPWPGDH